MTRRAVSGSRSGGLYIVYVILRCNVMTWFFYLIIRVRNAHVDVTALVPTDFGILDSDPVRIKSVFFLECRSTSSPDRQSRSGKTHATSRRTVSGFSERSTWTRGGGISKYWHDVMRPILPITGWTQIKTKEAQYSFALRFTVERKSAHVENRETTVQLTEHCRFYEIWRAIKYISKESTDAGRRRRWCVCVCVCAYRKIINNKQS